MTPERWKQVEEVFQAALDLPPDQRGKFIVEACAGDDSLRAEVEMLVAQYEKADGQAEAPAYAPGAFDAHSDPFRTNPVLDLEDDPMAGRRLGAYKIVREIGRGGMGAVYLAVRADSAFHKRVAIKLVKRGMDTDFILRRFRNERQILASLDHPHIARLLDGGTTDDGRPYFVMEYIEGQPLYRYCDARKLAVPERLRLFSQVCSAVHYAHTNLVIHRDIKPGNILVTADGTPKLLDFGIAKLLNPELTPDTFTPTATAMRLMTPEYASPEQVRGEAATPASDIYSLGVLLYELLTGHRPYHFRNRSSHEIARVICEEEPEHPSMVVGQAEDILMLDAPPSADSPTVEFICKTRGGTPDSLGRELAGNLDNIILKSLRKEPARRYASVEKLREDIQRHLEGRPISAPFFFPHPAASKPSTGDSPSGEKTIAVLPFKMLSTHLADETGDIYLGIGLADTLITRLSNVRRFSVRPTSSVVRYQNGDSDPFNAGHELGVSYIVDGHIRRASERLRITVQLLNVRDGATMWAGQFDEKFTDVLSLEDAISSQVAEALVPKLSGDEREQLAKRSTDNPEAYEAYLRGRYHWTTFTEEGFAKAITSYYRAIALDPDYAIAYTGIADYYNWLGVFGVLPPGECFAAAKEAATKALNLDPTLGEAHTALGFATLTLAFDWMAAESQHRRALELSPNYATAHVWYGFQLAMEGRFDEAVAEARRAIELDPLSGLNRHCVGWCLYHARRYEESIAEYRKINEADTQHGMAHFGYSWALRQVGMLDASVREAAITVELMPDTPFALAGLGSAFAAAGKTLEAHRILRELHELGAKRYVSPYHLALVYCHLGDREQAFAHLEQAFENHDAWVVWLGVEPQLDPLRADPRFNTLLRRTKAPSNLYVESAPRELLEKTTAPIASVQISTTGDHEKVAASRRATGWKSRLRSWRIALPLALAAIVVAVAGVAYLRGWMKPSLAAENPARLTRNLVNDWQPVYSPDGERIAFASNRDGNYELYVMDSDGTEARRLTHNSTEDLTPVWSPDSTRIAFTSKRDGNDEVYVMNADGSNQTNLSRDSAADSRPAWSPDGTRLVFVSNRGGGGGDAFDIYVMNTDGSAPVRLTDDPKFDGDPAWSPDGTRIAFATNRTGDFEIHTMRADGANQTNISNSPAFEGKPAWSPDGKSIAFTSNRDPDPGDFDLYVMDFDGRNPRKITDNSLTDDEPEWSPDGDKIIYQSEHDGNYEIFAHDLRAPLTKTDKPAPNAPGLHSIAVLPFATVGATGDEQYLGVGIADVVTNKLSQLDEVTLRTSGAVRRYLGTPKSALEAGRELGVDYVLAGSVERVGERVQTALELTDTRTAQIMWAEKFDERFTDISTLQNSIAERVARALSLELTSDEQRRLNKRYTDNGESYQLYLAGRYHWGKRTPEGLRQAISNFEQAIARDERFALAYTGLADCYALLNWYLEPPPADAWERARTAARRAVEIDDALAEAHASLAFVKFHYERDWTGAEEQFRRAIGLNPNYPTAHHWYAFNLSAMERHDASIAEIQRAQELDPRSAVIATAVANVFYHARRYDESIAQCRKALELDPGSVAAHVVMRWAHEKKGMHEAAFAIYEKERAFAGDTPTTRAKLAHVLAASGRAAEARKVLQQLIAQRRQQSVTPYEIAVIYALLGDKDKAFQWLAQAEREHAVGFTFVRVDPHLDNLRSDPRYAELMRSTRMTN